MTAQASAFAKSVYLLAEPFVVFRFRMNQRMEALNKLSVADDDNTHRTNA